MRNPTGRVSSSRPEMQQLPRERTPEQQKTQAIFRRAMREDPESTTAALIAALREAFPDAGR